MKSAHIAAVVDHESSPANANHAVTLLGLLGIPCRVFNSVSELMAELAKASGRTFGVVAPLPAIQDLLAVGSPGSPRAGLHSIHSVFTYLTPDSKRALDFLKSCFGGEGLRLAPIHDKTEVTVSTSWPEFTGPMHGMRVCLRVDRVLQTEKSCSSRAIIETKDGPIFLELQVNGQRIFVSSSEEVIDIEQPLNRPWYDVKDHFVSAVPLLMYLKWAFYDVCWKPNEAGACLIIDDPILKLKYGFCDFRELGYQMREHDFATSIAVIPWNWRRTSPAMAELIRDSEGRLSVCVHGCDHTGAEFGSTAVSSLDPKAALAKARMERHLARTGIPHDLIMVFPQGVFSQESLSALQRHEFLAAVNTEVLPSNPTPEPLTISDMWSTTVTRFGSFPFFVRRYPAHGLENFAFDLLLGKPCLIVEHHKFFKDHGEQAISFVGRLNSLNCQLKWRGLGEVVKRCYHWRMDSEGTLYVRMFAGELLLSNESNQARNYEISKAEHNSPPINAVLANNQPIPWKSVKGHVTFRYEIAAGRDVAFQVRYPSSHPTAISQPNVNVTIKTAARRYLSELRDNYLSRHEGLLQLAQKTKRLIS